MPTNASPGGTWNRTTVALTAAYAVVLGLVLRPFDALGLLFFVGPLLIAAAFSMMLDRAKARIVLLIFATAYSLVSAAVFYWAFAFEHDAQYQLLLLMIPLLGFPTAVSVGLIARVIR